MHWYLHTNHHYNGEFLTVNLSLQICKNTNKLDYIPKTKINDWWCVLLLPSKLSNQEAMERMTDRHSRPYILLSTLDSNGGADGILIWKSRIDRRINSSDLLFLFLWKNMLQFWCLSPFFGERRSPINGILNLSYCLQKWEEISQLS